MINKIKITVVLITALILITTFMRMQTRLTKALSMIAEVTIQEQVAAKQSMRQGVTAFASLSPATGVRRGAGLDGKAFNGARSSSVFGQLPRSVAKELPKELSSQTSYGALTASLLRQYVGRLFFALAANLPAAICAALFAYVLAALEQAFAFMGRSTAARLCVLPCDVLPNILWILPLTTAARWIYSAQPESNSFFYQIIIGDYWQYSTFLLYQFLIYFGFSLFLLIFMYRQNYGLLRDCTPIIEAERLQGLGLASIYRTLFIHTFLRGVFLRQILFCSLFVFLMDFAFLSVANINQAYSTPTVFSEAARFSHQQQKAEVSSRNFNGIAHFEVVNLVLDTDSFSEPLQDLAAEVRTRPELMLDQHWRHQLSNFCKDQYSEIQDLCPDELTSKSWLSITPLLVENVFFMVMRNYYWSMNILVICVFFVLNIVVVDLKVLLNG
jgi:hypothetical protein